jgi:hypothetical protein
MSIVELPAGAVVPAETDFPRSGRVSVSEPDDEVAQVRRREKEIKTKRKLTETPSMLDPVRSSDLCLHKRSAPAHVQ